MRVVLILFYVMISATFLHAQDFTNRYSVAKKAMAAENLEEAVAILTELTGIDYILKDFVLFDLADSYQKVGEDNLALENYMKIIEEFRLSPLFKKSYLQAIKLKFSKDFDGAVQLAKEYLTNISDDDKVAAEIITFFVKNGKSEKFESNIKKMFLKGGNNFDFAYQQIKYLHLPISMAEVKSALKEAYKKGYFAKITKIIENELELDPELKLLLGKSYFSIRNYNAAIRYLSDTPFREGKITLASAFLRNNDRLASEIILKRLAKESEEGLYELYLRFAEIKRREGKFLDAKKELERLCEIYPKKVSETLWYLAWLCIKTGDYSGAEIILETLLNDKNYTDKDKILFWLGKIQDYKGADSRKYFLRLHSKSYYAVKYNGDKDIVKTETKPERSQTLPANIKMAFDRADELKKLSLNLYIPMEIKNVMNEITKEYLPQVATLLTNLQEYSLLLQISEKFGEVNSYSYPLAYYDEIHKISEKEGVDPFLVLSIMREESRFNQQVVSVVGAIGLMQLMPKTAKRFITVKSTEDIFNPINNIEAGAKYIAKLLREYKNIYYTVAAYNAGEHRVNGWRKDRYRDIDEFVEDIPFGETRNYVKKVLKSYYIYKKLYGELK